MSTNGDNNYLPQTISDPHIKDDLESDTYSTNESDCERAPSEGQATFEHVKERFSLKLKQSLKEKSEPKLELVPSNEATFDKNSDQGSNEKDQEALEIEKQRKAEQLALKKAENKGNTAQVKAKIAEYKENSQ